MQRYFEFLESANYSNNKMKNNSKIVVPHRGRNPAGHLAKKKTVNYHLIQIYTYFI